MATVDNLILIGGTISVFSGWVHTFLEKRKLAGATVAGYVCGVATAITMVVLVIVMAIDMFAQRNNADDCVTDYDGKGAYTDCR